MSTAKRHLTDALACLGGGDTDTARTHVETAIAEYDTRQRLIAPMDELACIIKDEAAEAKRYADSGVKRDDVKQILLVAIDAKTMDHLSVAARSMPHVRNYGVLVRRLVANVAKAQQAAEDECPF